jgi:hypothetical protein
VEKVMKYPKGHKKIGGRNAGVRNKKTQLIDGFAAAICDGGMGKFKKELNKLSGKDYIYAYLTLFEYVKPKLSRMDAVIEEKPTQADLNKLDKQELKTLLALKQKMSA